MAIKINTNSVIAEADYRTSPNFDERPEQAEISLLVIHNISLPPQVFGGSYIVDFFLNKLDISVDPFFETIADLKVSSHLFINREGKIIQFVPFDKRAWHAGKSQFEGVSNCNDYSIGIELEGTDNILYTKEQYEALIKSTMAIMDRYPAITMDRITGHSNIAPERKTDPGNSFNWKKYLDGLKCQK